MFNRYIGASSKISRNLWTVLEDLKSYEALANEKIRKAARGEIPYYLTAERQKKVQDKKEGIVLVFKNFKRENAKTFCRELKVVFNEFYFD